MNIADIGEKRGDIADTEERVQSDDDGQFFIQQRKNPERLFAMEPPELGTHKNLVRRVAALERKPCHVDKFTNLVSRVLSLEEDSRVPNIRVKLSVCQNTTIQGIGCDVVLGFRHYELICCCFAAINDRIKKKARNERTW